MITWIFVVSSVYAQNLQPHRLGIIVNDTWQAAHWYEKNLGFHTYKTMSFPEYDSMKIVFMRTGDFEIELVEKSTSWSLKTIRPDYNLNTAPLEGFVKIAFRTSDIKKLFDQLKKNNATFIVELTHDKTFETDFFIAEDPDGNMIQVIGSK